MGAYISNNRWLMENLYDFFFYLSGTLLFAGTFPFEIIQYFYRQQFDSKLRQKVTYNIEDINDYENPRIQGRNRRPAHAFLRSFADKKECLEYWSNHNRLDSELDNVFYLTGEAGKPIDDNSWKFMLVGDPKKSPTGWELPTYDTKVSKRWNSIALPGHWQLQGYDIPLYTNTAYPFAFDPPRARRTGEWTMTNCDIGLGSSTECSGALDPKEPGENATGLYRKTFKLPVDWKKDTNEHIFIVFEGVDSFVNIWLDGKYVGLSKDSCLPCEFDITDIINNSALKKGEEHVLAVQVVRWSDGSYLEDQDKWWLSGLYREIYLLKKPVSFISDYEFTSDITISSGDKKKKNVPKKTDFDDPYENVDDGKAVEVNMNSANITISVAAEGVLKRYVCV